TEKTVKSHLGSIFSKLGVNDRSQAILYAIKHRLVDID
ncbi:MAG: response regulator transcription factor, partial [Anaerolineae bacterium]